MQSTVQGHITIAPELHRHDWYICIAIPVVSNGEHVDRPFTSLVEDSRVRRQDLLPDVKHVKARSHQFYPRLVRTSVDLRLAADAGLSSTCGDVPFLHFALVANHLISSHT